MMAGLGVSDVPGWINWQAGAQRRSGFNLANEGYLSAKFQIELEAPGPRWGAAGTIIGSMSGGRIAAFLTSFDHNLPG
jgi:hypothetical protein